MVSKITKDSSEIGWQITFYETSNHCLRVGPHGTQDFLFVETAGSDCGWY